MSRGQLARTPENFPRMKHRAAGRIAKRQAQEQLPELLAAYAAAAEVISRNVTAFMERVSVMAESLSAFMRSAYADRQSDYALVPDNTKQ